MNDDPKKVFLTEASELLTDMETALLRCEDGTADPETINSIFRSAHTIKGSAGIVGFDLIVGFTHLVETLLDKVRTRALALDAATAALLISCKDHIQQLVDCAALGRETQTPEEEEVGANLTKQLGKLLGKDSIALGSHPLQSAAPGTPSSNSMIDVTGAAADTNSWHLSVRFSPNVLRAGMDPLSLLRYLSTFGEVAGVQVVDDAMPAANLMDAESCYLGLELRFDTTADKVKIEDAFEFFREDCQLRILPPHSLIDEYVKLLMEAPEGNVALGQMLIQCGTLTQRELDHALRVQHDFLSSGAIEAPKLGEILIQEQLVAPSVVTAALARQSADREIELPGAQSALRARSIRVDASKLERLISLVGELIIAAASTDVIARAAAVTALNESTFRLTTLVESIRDQALELRMVPIGTTFSRFPRIVRDLAQELGKNIRLEITGAETELDKTLIEQMNDPLMHLVRNAIDHGIEDAADRAARGKSAQGVVRLAAYHDAGAVVVEVGDDGRGLNRARILEKARERRVVGESEVLTDQQITALIFEPGLTTAAKITNLSGRGVGMDVVKRNIEALRGSVQVDSREGHGTTIRIRLPLTLAIIDGFQVRVGNSAFVIPLDMVEECVDLPPKEILGERQFINLRGKALPFVRLRELYAVQGAASLWESIVIVRGLGIVVDELIGKLQTVIKPLPQFFGAIDGIGGTTILGTGQVALVLDVPTFVRQCFAVRGKTAGANAWQVAAG